MIKKLTFPTNRRPTPERQRKAVEATKQAAAKKRYLKSVKYCQRCGKEVYPNRDGSYPLYEIVDERFGIPLLVCDNCKKGGEK